MSIDRLVIVGAGHAGFALAAALRQNGFAGALTLLGDEPGLPYNRPPLSKAFLSAQAAEEGLHFRPAAFYAENDIALRPGERAVAVDRAGRRLHLASGDALLFDHLVLATGARNRRLRVPGADLPGVHLLRCLAEAQALRARLPGLARAVVVGAGFIGLEFAATAALAGVAVTVLDAAPLAMGRALSSEAAARLQLYHESLGTRFRFGVGIAAVTARGGRAGGVELAGGERIEADLVLVGIGVEPNDGLAADAGLACPDGILVDAAGATADPAISALGDCACGPSPFGHEPLARLESVQNANDSARLLAARLCGLPQPAAPPVPWFWSDQGKAKLQIAGLAGPRDEVATIGGADAFSVLRFRGGRLACVESVNRMGDHLAARQLIARGAGPSLAEARGGAVDLKTLARAAA